MRRRIHAVLTTLAACLAASSAATQSMSADAPSLRVIVDSAHRRIHLVAGPFDLMAMPGMAHHTGHDVVLPLRWPVAGWISGWSADVKDANDRILSHRLIHHVGLLDFERRELLYDQLERVLAVGAETEDVTLPSYVGGPMRSGGRMAIYMQLHNDSDVDVHGAYVWLTIRWTRPGEGHPAEVYPFYADVNFANGASSAFDIPPGHSTRSTEFRPALSGGLVVAGGHVHDYASSIRLEDAEHGKVLVRLKATRDSAGHVTKLGRFVFGFHEEALHFEAGHPYRVVVEYDNPTGRTIEGAAMGFMVGPFIPDDSRDWPKIDANDPEIRRDLASLGVRDSVALGKK